MRRRFGFGRFFYNPNFIFIKMAKASFYVIRFKSPEFWISNTIQFNKN